MRYNSRSWRDTRQWQQRQWPNAVTKAVETKQSYVEKVDDLYIGCGVYK